MTLLEDMIRLLEAASHAMVAATDPNIDGVTVGPSAIRPVGGPAATGYVSGAGVRDGFHVGKAERGDHAHADRVDAAGATPQAPTAASTSMLVNSLISPPSPPLLPQIPALGTPLPVPSTTLVPLIDGDRDPSVALDTVSEAAARLVAAANMITAARTGSNASLDPTSSFVRANNTGATTGMATATFHRIPTDSNDAADNTVAAAATVAPAANMVAPFTHAGVAVNAVSCSCTVAAASRTVAPDTHTGVETLTVAVASMDAATSTGAAGSTCALASTGAPARMVAAASKTVSPVGSGAAADTIPAAGTVAAASETVSPVRSGAAVNTGATTSTVAAACKTVSPVVSSAAANTGAAANTVTTPETLSTAEETVEATSTVGALKTPASVATTGASTRANANADTGFVVDSGAAGNPMDIDAPSTERVPPEDPEARSPRSGVTSTRGLCRMGTPSLRSGGRSSREKRTAGRNADANAPHQLYVCPSCFTHFCSLFLSHAFLTAAYVYW